LRARRTADLEFGTSVALGYVWIAAAIAAGSVGDSTASDRSIKRWKLSATTEQTDWRAT
jgi:hypothetical protein